MKWLKNAFIAGEYKSSNDRYLISKYGSMYELYDLRHQKQYIGYATTLKGAKAMAEEHLYK